MAAPTIARIEKMVAVRRAQGPSKSPQRSLNSDMLEVLLWIS